MPAHCLAGWKRAWDLGVGHWATVAQSSNPRQGAWLPNLKIVGRSEYM